MWLLVLYLVFSATVFAAKDCEPSLVALERASPTVAPEAQVGRFARFFDYRALENGPDAAENINLELARTEQFLDFVNRSLSDFEQTLERGIAEQHKQALQRMQARLARGESSPVVEWEIDMKTIEGWGSPSLPQCIELGKCLDSLVRNHGFAPENVLMRTFIASREDLVRFHGTDRDSTGTIRQLPDHPLLKGIHPDDVIWANPLVKPSEIIPYAPKAYIQGMMRIALYDRTKMDRVTDEIWKFKNPSKKTDAVIATVRPSTRPK